MANHNQTVKVIKSTQAFSPIRDVHDGIIVTKDGRFVKVMEFTPINFALRSAAERAGIIDAFAQAIKLLPTTAQWKVISRTADISKIEDRIIEEQSTEDNGNCKQLQTEQLNLIRRMKSVGGISRRFLLAFEYELPAGLTKKPAFEDIRDSLEYTASQIAAVLAPCGNTVLNTAGDDYAIIEILHALMCRLENEDEEFKLRVDDTMEKYLSSAFSDEAQNDIYVPVNDVICPYSIDTEQSSNHIVVNDTYYAFGYLPSVAYPTKVTGGWLSVLTDFGIGVDVDVFIHKESLTTVQQKLQYAIRINRVKANTTDETVSGYENLLNAIDSGFYLRQGIANGEDFIYMSVLLTISAASEKELKLKIRSLKEYLATQGLQIKLCRFQHSDAFISALPICALSKNLYRKSRRNILTTDAASAYPFVSFEVSDPTGIMYGVNSSNNSLVFIDNFDTRQYKNANIVILGTSGSGKTYTLQCLALRMRQQKTQVFIIAPDKGHEFKRACEAIGGQYVKISTGSDQSINIMEIRKKNDANILLLDGDDNGKDSILSRKIQQLHTFMALLIPDMSYEEKQVLDEALVLTYEKYGITHRNRSLKDPENPGRYKKMPTLGDLYKTLGDKADKEKNAKAARIRDILTRYVSGSAKAFNRPTNVDLNNKYIVLDISDLTDEMMPIGMFIVLDYVYDKAREDRTARKAIFVDEAWHLMGAHSFLTEIFKTIRGYGGAAVAATQDMHDFFAFDEGRFGKAVINNAKIKLIMSMEQDEAEFVQDTLNLTDKEVQQITRFRQGEALIVANSNHVSVSIKASQTENDLITTDREQLKNLADRIKMQKEADLQS